MNISLPETLKTWVDEQVARGGFSSASEFVRHVLREAQTRRIRAAIDAKLLEALDGGEATEMTSRDWEGLREKVRATARQRRAR